MNGLQAGNWIDSGLTQAALVDNPVGGVQDAMGGINATQTLTGSKPILRRGLLNLLTWSNDFSNAAWVKQSGVAAAGNVISGATALTWDAAGTMQRSMTVQSGTAYTYAIRISSAGATTATIRLRDGTTGAVSDTVIALTGDLTTAVVSKTTGASSTSFGLLLGNTNGNVFVESAALFQGTYTAAQIQALGGIPLTTTAPASTALGPQYWQFDGSNDSLQLGGPLWSGMDDHTVVFAASATTGGDVFAQRSSSSASPLYPLVRFDTADSKIKALWRDDAGLLQMVPSDTTYSTNSSYVVAVRKSGNTKELWVNQDKALGVATSAIATATVNTSSIGCNIQAAAGGFLSGGMSGAVCIKGAATDADLLMLRKLVANMSGVQI